MTPGGRRSSPRILYPAAVNSRRSEIPYRPKLDLILKSDRPPPAESSPRREIRPTPSRWPKAKFIRREKNRLRRVPPTESPQDRVRTPPVVAATPSTPTQGPKQPPSHSKPGPRRPTADGPTTQKFEQPPSKQQPRPKRPLPKRRPGQRPGRGPKRRSEQSSTRLPGQRFPARGRDARRRRPPRPRPPGQDAERGRSWQETTPFPAKKLLKSLEIKPSRPVQGVMV